MEEVLGHTGPLCMPVQPQTAGAVVDMVARTLERHLSTLVEHRAIIDALTDGKPEKVQQAIRTYVDSSLRALNLSVGE